MDVLKLSRGFSFFPSETLCHDSTQYRIEKKIENCLPNYSVSTQYFWDGDLEGSQICPHNKRSFCIFIGSLINCWNHKSHVCTIGRYSEWLWHCVAANKKRHSHRKILFASPTNVASHTIFPGYRKKNLLLSFFSGKSVCLTHIHCSSHRTESW